MRTCSMRLLEARIVTFVEALKCLEKLHLLPKHKKEPGPLDSRIVISQAIAVPGAASKRCEGCFSRALIAFGHLREAHSMFLLFVGCCLDFEPHVLKGGVG